MLRLLQQQQHHLHHRRPALAGLLPRALAAHGAEAPGPDRPSARYSAVPAPEPAPPAPGETDLSRTLCLPKTEYPMRADAARREPLLRHRATTGLYHQQLADPARQGRTFVLHDGPPYANGRIHMGHCLNRVLKDFVMRYRLLRGDRVVSIPGWDCHGLPIELKAQEAFSKRQKAASKKRKQADPPAGAPAPSSSPMDVRHLARDFALSTIREQRDVFERLGILADLSDEGLAAHTYQTLDPRFEAAQLTVFAKMVARGNIYRDYKPVYWSPASRTALAEAELEYADNYVSRSVLVKFPLEKCPHDSALLIWTTTPWTLPANMAVAVSPGLEYVLVRPPAGPEAQQPSQPVWVARARVGYLAGELGCAEEDLTVLASAPGTELVGRRYTAPYAGQCAAAGPGAPSAHLFTVVDATYVTDDSGTGLVHTAPAHGLDDYVRCRALGMNFDSFGAVLMDEATVLHVRDVLLRNGGTDAWWTLPVGDLLPPGLAAEADLYEKGTDTMDVWFDSGTSWAHLLDRLEELGALPAEHPAALDVQGDFAPVQADVYLEGSDQHRGWFQSALLTSIASRGIAPYKTLITHGFINDDNGAKMSKSIGNVLEPDHFILGGKNLKSNPAYGTDVLRMWASSVEYTSDVSVGPVSIGRISETMRKLRNTSRFILGNLYDFEFGRDAVPYERLRETDKYVLHLLAQYVDDAASAYDRFQFNHGACPRPTRGCVLAAAIPAD
ncbi:hypothetical protein H696_06021 [Fonticula alba]|uniref:isoleucine--tRNA ligase n=1 Tax=Fonticula alba TaxID=691883 RepID=A0A058Z076_FONAL|nr:hypothetical protein H696_06021 [Fonticula alba]KCV67501.1 hypothetical protein H696_06021 [Fonticula alba]|eukprot:XP_009498062.1 hypothetical protein H696_06021 [Fonticula alba]